MNYVKDKLDDTLWEAQLSVLRDGASNEECYALSQAALIELLVQSVAVQQVNACEVTLLANGIDCTEEIDDLAYFLRHGVFNTLKEIVSQWKEEAGC